MVLSRRDKEKLKEPNIFITNSKFNYFGRWVIMKALYERPMTYDELVSLPVGNFEDVLAQLLEAGNVVLKDNHYFPILPSFYELGTPLIKDRIKGYTLKELALNKSVEAIRKTEKRDVQEIVKEYRLNDYNGNYGSFIILDNLYEDIVPYLALSKELRSELSLSEKSAFYYLPNKESMNIVQALNGKISSIPSDFLQRLINIYNPCVFTDGTVFPTFTLEAYIYFLKQNQSACLINKSEEKSPAYYRNNKSPYILKTDKHGNVRYYDYDKYKEKLDSILERLKTDNLQGKVHIYYLYRKNRELVKKIGIHNKYELHSLLRKHQIENIRMLRSPYIEITTESKP